MSNQELDIKEGTIDFWVKEGRIQFNDNQAIPLIQLSPSNGSIFMVKDSDNKLKFFHVYLGKGRTDVEYDASSLNPNQKHMIAVTWSLKNKEVIMYVDGQQVAKTEIKYKD
jgi:hypothetical protein